MATSDDALETYTHLPLHIDPQTKAVSITTTDQSMLDAVASCNALHSAFKTLETPNGVPPPPIPVNPKRSAQINKLRESAGLSMRKNQSAEAIRMLGFAIEMAQNRPPWEPIGLVREELAICYMARGNAYVLAQDWVDGLKDAQCSVECKKGPQQGQNGQKVLVNPRAWAIGGKCLVEMSRWSEAVTWLEQGLETEGKDGDDVREMERLLAQARAQIDKT